MPNLTPTLETKRLILRPVTIDDAPDVQRLISNYEIVRYMGSIPWPYPADGALQFYRERHLPKIARGETVGWGVTRKEDGMFMGALDIHLGERNMIGFWLGLPFQRKGYMGEAIVAAYDHAFEAMHLPQLMIDNAEANIASHTLQAKSGAELIDVRPSKYPEGELPQERWRLTPEAWRASPMKRAANTPSYILR